MLDKLIEILDSHLGYGSLTSVSIAKEILSLFPSLDGIVVEEECEHCLNGYISVNLNLNPNIFKSQETVKCPHCHGTGTITRQAEWGDLVEWAKYLLRASEKFEEYKLIGIYPTGRLRVK